MTEVFWRLLKALNPLRHSRHVDRLRRRWNIWGRRLRALEVRHHYLHPPLLDWIWRIWDLVLCISDCWNWKFHVTSLLSMSFFNTKQIFLFLFTKSQCCQLNFLSKSSKSKQTCWENEISAFCMTKLEYPWWMMIAIAIWDPKLWLSLVPGSFDLWECFLKGTESKIRQLK